MCSHHKSASAKRDERADGPQAARFICYDTSHEALAAPRRRCVAVCWDPAPAPGSTGSPDWAAKQWRMYFTDVHPTGIGPQIGCRPISIYEYAA